MGMRDETIFFRSVLRANCDLNVFLSDVEAMNEIPFTTAACIRVLLVRRVLFVRKGTA